MNESHRSERAKSDEGNMPGISGIEATRQIKVQQPDSRIVALSLHEEEQVIRAMPQIGVAAYVRNAPARELFAAIRGVRDPER